jgi:hypothetical protein
MNAPMQFQNVRKLSCDFEKEKMTLKSQVAASTSLVLLPNDAEDSTDGGRFSQH